MQDGIQMEGMERLLMELRAAHALWQAAVAGQEPILAAAFRFLVALAAAAAADVAEQAVVAVAITVAAAVIVGMDPRGDRVGAADPTIVVLHKQIQPEYNLGTGL